MEETSSTWLLFASGNYAAIDTYLYPASSESTRPIDAYIVSECQGDFTKSARRAADLTYHIYQKKHPVKPLVVGYDIHTTGEETLTGRSGGLSFVAALAKALLLSSGYKIPGAIAATGEILSRGNIGPIIGIKAKMAAANHLLGPGSWFFYPKDNHDEVDKALLKEILAKGINAHAISNISEIIDLLETTSAVPKKSVKKKSTIPKKAVIFMLISTVIFLTVFLLRNKYLHQKSVFKTQTTQQVKLQSQEAVKLKVTLTPRKTKNKKIHQQQAVTIPNKPAKDMQTFIFTPPIK